MSKLLFGTAGVPRSAPKSDTLSGLERIKELGLEAMELEFVRGVKMNQTMAQRVRAKKEELDLKLTVHGPYFINLNSAEPEKISASIQRILESARIGALCGAESVTFHAAFYMNQPPQKVYQTVKQHLTKIVTTLRREKVEIMIKPELTGKPSQFGSLEELLRLAKEVVGVAPCIDFAHLHARTRGKYNSYKEFTSVLQMIGKQLGKKALQDLHLHVSGIAYTTKGERKHLNLQESDFNYQDLLKALKDYKVAGILISESPNLEGDALLMQKAYRALH